MCRGAMQFLLCRNATARYFSPVRLLKNITQCHPKIIWHQGYGNHSITPPSGLSRAPAPTILNSTSSENGRTMFAPTDYSGRFVVPQSRFARCFIFTSCLCTTLVSYANSSFLTPHSSLSVYTLCTHLHILS